MKAIPLSGSFKNQMQLTKQEQNLVKDILKTIGTDQLRNKFFAATCGMPEVEFDAIADSVFKKLGNGRVTQVD